MNLLVVIPARGGSKGLPRKNLQTVGGVSLVGRAVVVGREFVRLAGLPFASVLVDTDSPEIAHEGRRWGAEVPFLRPAHLALDETPTVDSVLYAADRIAESGRPVDALMLLQPTSPLRAVGDLQRCWREFHPLRSPSVVSVAASPHPVELAVRLAADGTLSYVASHLPPAVRRQMFPLSYFPNGAVYLVTLELLRQERNFIISGTTKGVIMPPDRSVDVDSADDLAIAEALDSRSPTRMFVVGAETAAGDAAP